MSVTSKSEVMEILSMPEEVFHREITPLARNVAKQQGFESVFLISGEDPFLCFLQDIRGHLIP